MQKFKAVPMPSECVPREICEDCCASNAIFHYRTETLSVYCPHNKTGAILPLNSTWGILSGIEATRFIEILVKALTKAKLSEEIAWEIKKLVAEKQAINFTKH